MSLVAVLAILAAIGLLLAFDPGGAIDRSGFPDLRDMSWKDLTVWGFRIIGIGVSMLIVVWLWFKYLPNRRVKYPEVSGSSVWQRNGLPAAAVSVLEDRSVNDRTLLAAIVEMCQRGTLKLECAATGDSYEYSLSQLGSPQFEWERSICLILPSGPVTVHEMRDRLEFHKEALGDQLGDYLKSRGLFNDNPVRVMREHYGDHFELQLLAWALMGVGGGLWSALWLSQWWANSLIGLAIGFTYSLLSVQTESGKILPTQAGALEIGRARALKESLSGWGASDRGEDSETMLPYAIGLDTAKAWLDPLIPPPAWFGSGGAASLGLSDLNAAYQSFISSSAWGLAGRPDYAADAAARAEYDRKFDLMEQEILSWEENEGSVDRRSEAELGVVASKGDAPERDGNEEGGTRVSAELEGSRSQDVPIGTQGEPPVASPGSALAYRTYRLQEQVQQVEEAKGGRGCCACCKWIKCVLAIGVLVLAVWWSGLIWFLPW